MRESPLTLALCVAWWFAGQPSLVGQTPAKAVPSGKAALPPPVRTPSQLEGPPPSILDPKEAPIDLGSALRLAGVENPELLRARERVTEVAAARQLAAAQLLPNLNVGGNYDMHVGALQQLRGNILEVNRDALYYGLGANAVAAGTVSVPGLSYNLNVGETWYRFLAARQRVRTERAAADAVRNDVLLRVCLAYTDLLRAEGRRAIARTNRDDAFQVARLTEDFAQTGQGRQADADRAAVDLKKRDAELIQAEASVATASARLGRLLNLDPSTRLRPIDGWVIPAPIVPDPVPLADLVAIALVQRPELAARRSEVRTTLYELSLAKVLPFAPNVVLGLSAGDFGGGSNLISSAPGFINGSGQQVIGPRFGDFAGRTDLDVAVFWTFRNLGVGNLAMIRAADSRMKQSKLRELETLNQVRTEVAEAHALVAAHFLEIEAAEKATKASQRAFSRDLDRIKGGQGLPLEVMDSLRLLARSRYDYLDAIVDYNRANFQLWVALGRPPAACLARPVPADLVPPPSPADRPSPAQLPAPRPVRP